MMRCDDGGGADGTSDQRPSAASVAAFGLAIASAAAMALSAVRFAPDPGGRPSSGSGSNPKGGQQPQPSIDVEYYDSDEDRPRWKDLDNNIDSDNCDSVGECRDNGEQTADVSDGDDGRYVCAEADVEQKRRRPSKMGVSKLGRKAQFPESMNGVAIWDMDDLRATQEWKCPCRDRSSCLSSDRIPITHFYEYRK
eukprot:5519771-Pleurochrysis_carterae.AAC.1